MKMKINVREYNDDEDKGQIYESYAVTANNSIEAIPLEEEQERPHLLDEQNTKIMNLVQQQHQKYGSFKVLYDGCVFLSIGPNYCCFLTTFILFCFTSLIITLLVHSTTERTWALYLNGSICFLQLFFYLLMAISNPGIVINDRELQNWPQSETRMCKKCHFRVPKDSRHCGQCKCCIRHYDHHCQWTSKCIGGQNLNKFYLFLFWTPFYLIYLAVAFVVCMSSNIAALSKAPPKLF